MLRLQTIILAVTVLLLNGCGSSVPLNEIDCSRFPEAVHHDESFPPEQNVTIESDMAEKILVHKEYPKYPELAMRAGLEGTVLIRLWIDRNGTVKQASILKSDAEIFNDVSLAAAKKLVFRPTSCDGRRISVWARIPIRFKLTN